MPDLLTPDGVAQSKRDTMMSLTALEYNQWRHNAVTAGFLQYMQDMIAFYREMVADMLEAGQFEKSSQHQDRNPDCLRGQILMLRQLHDVEIEHIQRFYGAEEQETKEDEEPQYYE